MKKLFKKSISCIVAVLMVLSSMPFTALTANAALVKQDIAVWDAANVTTATPGTGTKFTHTDSSTNVSINGVHWGSASKADGNGYVTFNNATISSEAGFASLNIKGDVWTFSSKFATTGSGQDDQNTQQTTNDDSTIFGIGTATTRNYSPSDAVKRSGMAADLVNITKNGNIYLAGSSTSSGNVGDVISTSADDVKTLTVAYENGNLTISLGETPAYEGTVDEALFSQGVSNFFIGTSAQVYAGGTAPYYGLTNAGHYTYGTHLYSLSASVSYDPTIVPPSENAQIAKNNIDHANRTYNNVSITGADTNYMNGVIKGTSFGGSTTATVNGFSDSTSTKHESKVHGLTDGVAIYTGSGCDIRFPVVYEHLNGGNKTGVTHYLGIDHLYFSSGNFQLGQDTWKRCSGWNNLTDDSDNSHDFSALSTGNVDRAENSSSGRFTGTDKKYWKNCIKYTGSVNTDTYYEKLTSAEFNYQADYTWTWWAWSTKWSSNSNYTSTFSSNFGLYVLNYAPLKEIIESEDFKSNFERIYNNRANYNETERENYFDVMADITTFDLSTRAMTTEDEVRAVATEIKGMVERYNQYKSPSLLGNIVTFVNANGDTVESRLVPDGNAIGAFPENTAVQGGITGYEGIHYTYTWDTTLTAESTVDADVTIREKENGVDCSGGEATCISKARCSVCGYEYGSVNANNHKNTRTVAAQDSTCTEAGWEAYTYCDDCNKVVGEKVDLPLARHDYEVTKKDDTYHTYNCKNCTDSYDEAHDWGEYVVTTPATCTDNAVETATCTVDGCGATTSREVADSALGHDYQYAELDADNHTVTCSRCDLNETKPHDFGDGNVCSLCGYVKTTIDRTAYDDAVADYDATISAPDYETMYTAQSRDAYEKAVAAAKINDFTSQAVIDAATSAIVSAKTKLCLANVDIKVYLVDEIGVATEITELSTTKPYGTKVTVDVTDKLAANQMISKWTIQTQGTAVTTKLSTVESAIDIIATEPTDVYVSYVESASTEADPVVYSKVSFISKNGAVAFVKYVEEGTTLDTTTADLKLEIPFYEFKGWSKDTIYADGSDIEVKAIYEFIENTDNRCNVHYNGTTKSYAYDSFVYLFGAEGENLALSTDGTEANIITYLNENAFYAPHTENIYVIKVTTQKASIGITGSYSTSTDTATTYAFNCKFFVPDGCTVVEYGLIGTAGGVSKKIKGEKSSDRGEFTVKITASGLSSMNGQAYLTYRTSGGELKTIYSTTVTQA